MVQFANAALGPPVYMAKPNSTGRPEMKFIVMYVAAQLSKSPRWRKNSGNASSIPAQHRYQSSFWTFWTKLTLLIAQLREVLLIFGEHRRLTGRHVPVGRGFHIQLLVIHVFCCGFYGRSWDPNGITTFTDKRLTVNYA